MTKRLKPTRYIPLDSTEIKDKEAKAVVYVFDNRNGQPCAIAYGGKRNKPDFHNRFANEARRACVIHDYFAGQKAHYERKAKRKQEHDEFKSPAKVGDILSGTWGYDQTNVEFFKVVEVSASGKSVKIRELAHKSVKGSEGFMSEARLPDVDNFLTDHDGNPKPTLTKRVQPYGPQNSHEGMYRVKLYKFCSLTPWSGRSVYCSWYA